ncbi:uncharacterized protein LOC116412415 [Xenopus tropicalis]|uniref:Uncharacterized protein LOC116412415 n=1 Tax=Xenopus tropicalis TaxID=8364 RepID=A0A8J1JX54_XENTR|nr:uncharacterized protein LOC116412415 [Xenopus tropicalis]
MDKSDSCKATPKRRKKRFSDREDHALVDEIVAHHGELFGKTTCNALRRALIWESVAKKVNDAGETKRSVMECKKRWSDYKRKVKRTINHFKMNASVTGILEPLDSFLSGRQMHVAHIFHLNSDDQNAIQILSDTSYLDEAPDGHKCQYVNENSMDVVDLLSISSMNSDHQDNFPLSQPCDIGQSSKTSQWHIGAQSPPITCKASLLGLSDLELKLDSLIEQQTKTNEILQCIQKDIGILLSLQRKMNWLLRNNFTELQRSIMFIEKMLKDQENYLELSLQRIHRKLEGMNCILRESKLQGT